MWVKPYTPNYSCEWSCMPPIVHEIVAVCLWLPANLSQCMQLLRAVNNKKYSGHSKIKQYSAFDRWYCCQMQPIQVNRAALQPHAMHTVVVQWAHILRVKAGGKESTYRLLTTCQMPSKKRSAADWFLAGRQYNLMCEWDLRMAWLCEGRGLRRSFCFKTGS